MIETWGVPCRPQIQRLLTRGNYELPSSVIFDCAAIARWNHDEDPSSDSWDIIIEAIRRSSRTSLLVVGPLKKPHPVVGHRELVALWERLRGQFHGQVAWSEAPAMDVVSSLNVRHPVGFITANVELRPYELAVLNYSASAVVDVASGRIFSRALAEREFGTLHDIAFRTALIQPEPGEAPIVKELIRYRDEVIENWDSTSQSFEKMRLPQRVLAAISSKWDQFIQETTARVVTLREDDVVREICARIAPMPTDNVVYVAASFANGWITSAAAVLPDGRFVPPGDPRQVLQAVTQASGDARWFVPQALEVQGLAEQLPGVFLTLLEDPAVQAYVLDPDEPPRLEELSPCLLDAPRRVLDALNDHRREGFYLSPEDLGQVVRLLPQVRVDVRNALDARRLITLVDDDLTPSRAVIGRIERRGMQISVPAQGWPHFRETLAHQLISVAGRASDMLGRDVRTASDRDVLLALGRAGLQVSVPPNSSEKDIIERYSAAGSQLAADILMLRSISKTEKWIERLEQSQGHLQGRMHFIRTGRLYYSGFPLGSLPKEGMLAEAIRGQLVAPAGMTLIAADWNAFEPRILASLLDPSSKIHQAAQAPDLYQELTTFAGMARGEVKAALLAILYGQSRDGFIVAQHQFDPNYAMVIFKIFRKGFPELKDYRARQLNMYAHSKEIRTYGGWRRNPRIRQRTRVPHLPVQGLGAELLRFVLRELDERLSPLGAMVVHQQHDEIVVAAPDAVVDSVKVLLAEVMEREAPARLPTRVLLPVRIKTGKTWKDLL